MKVGVIGTHWGRVHVGAFRSCGHEVAVLLGQDLAETERIAREEKIPRATVDPLDLRAMDVVVIASPTPTHRRFIEMFLDRPVLCEKPLCGVVPDRAFIESLEKAPVFVNYAFPFLDTAILARRLIQEDALGPVFRIVLNVSFRLPQTRTDVDGFLDLASHPLSFLNLLFGPFRLLHSHSSGARPNLSLLLDNGSQLLNVNLYEAAHESISYELSIVGERAEMRLRGAYRPSTKWNFQPLLIDGLARNDGEISAFEDVWVRANLRVVRAFVDVVEGRKTREQAVAEGLCDGPRAAWIEQTIEPILRAQPVT